MSYFNVKNEEISRQANNIAMDSIQFRHYIDQVVDVIKKLKACGKVVLENSCDLEHIVDQMNLECDVFFSMGMKLQEAVELYQDTENKLVNNVDEQSSATQNDLDSESIVENDETKKENMMLTVLERMKNEFKMEGDLDRANGIEELTHKIQEDGLDKFMAEHTNKLTGCVAYTSGTGIKFFVDKVKLYKDEDIANMHKKDTCFVAGMGLIPEIGTFAGPLTGLLVDEQQNNSSIVSNVATNTLGSVLGNLESESKFGRFKLGEVKIGTVLGPAYTALTTGVSLNGEDRKIYMEEIDPGNGEKYYIPLNQGVEQVTIRCQNTKDGSQKTINTYVNSKKYLSYEKYILHGKYS